MHVQMFAGLQSVVEWLPARGRLWGLGLPGQRPNDLVGELANALRSMSTTNIEDTSGAVHLWAVVFARVLE